MSNAGEKMRSNEIDRHGHVTAPISYVDVEVQIKTLSLLKFNTILC
jgi:hypothetical protein